MSYNGTIEGQDVRQYDEIDEILRSRDFLQHQPARENLIGGSILLIDGDDHHQRRRMEAALFTKPAIVHYERVALLATIEEVLDGVDPGPGGAVVDLVPLVRDMLHRIAAGVTGLDDVESPIRVDAFRRQVELLHFGSTVEVSIRPTADVLAEARAAREEYVRDFYQPSLERRRSLHLRRVAGEEVEMPIDLLALLVSHGLDGADWALAESVLYVIAAISTTTHALPHVIRHLDEWVGADETRRERLQDPQLIRAAIAESLRLHTPNPVLARRAVRSTTLECSGRRVEEGEVVVLHFGEANRDAEVFGAKPDAFDPDREVGRGVKGWGHTFGGGRHTCIGRPLVTGVASHRDPDLETDGTMTSILRALYRRGVTVDATLGHELNTQSRHDAYQKFHVRLHQPR